jgi:glycosyltransferase involved in cell wall biosynthesis
MTVGHVMYFDPANYPPVINSCRVLAARGNHVELLGYYRGLHRGFTAGDGISEHYLNDPPGSFPPTMTEKLSAILRFRRAVERWARVVKPSVIVAHDLHGFWGAATLLGRIPIVLHVHDMPDPDGGAGIGRLDRRILGRAIRQVPRAAALVMPEASRLRRAIEEWRFAGPAFVVANCPSLAAPGRTTILRDLIRQRSGRAPEWIVVRAGGAGPVHLIDETVRAFRSLPDGCHLCLIGCGDEPYAVRLERLALELGLARRVHSFPYVCYDDLRAYLKSADIGLAIYRRQTGDINKELMGTASAKHMEYVGVGIASVLSEQESFKILGDSTGAVVLRGESAEAIAECLLSLTREPTLYRRLCDLAQKAHARRYHYERQYAPICTLIDALGERDPAADSVATS